MSRDPDPIHRLAAIGALAVLVGWIAWRRWELLSSSPYPYGIDGYFYPVQLRSLLESGALYYPSAPLSFWLMAPLAAIGGPVWAVKVGAAIATALIAVPLYGISRELGADRASSLLAGVVCCTAAASFYFSVEFVKNGFGLTVAGFAIWALLWAHRRGADGRGRRRAGVAFATIALAWLTHKSAAALILVATGPLAVYWLRDRATSAWISVTVVVVFIAAVSVATVTAPGRFLSAGDAALAGDLWAADADFTMPVLRLAQAGGERALYFGHEVPLAALAAVLLWGLWRWRGWPEARRTPIALAGLGAFAVFCALPFIDVSHPDRLGFRLRLLAFFALAAHVGPLATAVLAGLEKRAVRAAVALAIAGFVFAFRPPVYAPPMVEQHPALVSAARAATGLVPEGDTIVTPERRLVFMLTWFTRRRATQRPDAVPAARRWRLLPLPAMSPELRDAIIFVRTSAPAVPSDGPLVHSLHPYDAMGLVLMPERAWELVLGRLSPDARAHYDRWPTY